MVDPAHLDESLCPCRYHSHPEPLDKVLRRRGQIIKRTGDWTKTLHPDGFHTGIHGDTPERFRTHFGKASFRSLLRKLTGSGMQPLAREALPALDQTVLDNYLEFLEVAGLVQLTPESVQMKRRIPDIGSTFEWYVATVFATELAGSSEWGVRFTDLPANGDFDVLAWIEPTLVYVETKTSPPDRIKPRALREFLQRTQRLSADISILLVDTTSELIPVLDALQLAMLPVVRKLSRRPEHWIPECKEIRPSESFPGVYFTWPGIHIVSSEPSVETQLRRCLQHFHAKARGAAWYDGRPTGVNFLTGEIHET